MIHQQAAAPANTRRPQTAEQTSPTHLCWDDLRMILATRLVLISHVSPMLTSNRLKSKHLRDPWLEGPSRSRKPLLNEAPATPGLKTSALTLTHGASPAQRFSLCFSAVLHYSGSQRLGKQSHRARLEAWEPPSTGARCLSTQTEPPVRIHGVTDQKPPSVKVIIISWTRLTPDTEGAPASSFCLYAYRYFLRKTTGFEKRSGSVFAFNKAQIKRTWPRNILRWRRSSLVLPDANCFSLWVGMKGGECFLNPAVSSGPGSNTLVKCLLVPWCLSRYCAVILEMLQWHGQILMINNKPDREKENKLLRWMFFFWITPNWPNSKTLSD